MTAATPPTMQPPAPPSSGRHDETLKVRAPINDPPPIGEGPQFETMHASHDPAVKDQAVLLNAPFFCDYLNFGDLVRVGEAVDGACPVLEVVTASGHARLGVGVGSSRHVRDLLAWLRERFPDHTLRMEAGYEQLAMISIHPDLDPDDVGHEIADWLDEQGARDDPDAAISEVFETQLGLVEWPAEND